MRKSKYRKGSREEKSEEIIPCLVVLFSFPVGNRRFRACVRVCVCVCVCRQVAFIYVMGIGSEAELDFICQVMVSQNFILYYSLFKSRSPLV